MYCFMKCGRIIRGKISPIRGRFEVSGILEISCKFNRYYTTLI